MRRLPTLLLALLVLTIAQAQAPAPPWWRTAVCPMVGPFNTTSGTKGKSPDQILQDFQPEVAEWSCLPALKANPLCPRGIAGGLEYQEYPQSPKRDYQLWLEKFGTAFEPTEENGVAVNSTGKLQDLKYGSETATLYYVCHNAPRWHALHRDSIIRAAQNPEISLVRQDNIGVPSGVLWDNGGWCKWCLSGFKQRLQMLFKPEQLKDVGIADIAAFDPKAYLQQALKRPAEQRLEDPVVVQYTRFMVKSNLDAWADDVKASHQARPEIPICGNQGGGGLTPFPYLLLSDASDLIFLENSNRAFTTNSNSVNYAVALAGGRHSKPAWIWDFGSEAFMQQVDGSRLFVAECYANGATPYYEINNLGHSPQKGYYAIALGEAAYGALSGYATFAREHRDLLADGYRAETPVALLYSMPSYVPRYSGGVTLGGNVPATDKMKQHFMGWARALEASHVPYNVEVLGDEEMWPDRDLPRRLAQYRLVILPAVDAISDAQLAALEQYRAAGGRILTSGPFATRKETFQKRDQPADALCRRANVTALTDEPVDFVRTRAVDESRGASQTVQVNQTEAKPLVVRGWSKPEKVSGPTDHEYALWVDLTYQDGTPLWAQVAPFKVGTHDWQMSEFVIHPAKPVKSATVHALLRYHSGRAWFDDLFFGEEGSDTNLLRNPGFEGGDGQKLPEWEQFLGWQKMAAGYMPDPKTAHSGAQSVTCFIPEPQGEAPAALRMREVLAQALRGLGPQLATTAPASVFIRPVRHGKQTIVHLLNLDLDADADRIIPCPAFRVSVPLPAGTRRLAPPVLLHSPDAVADASLQAEVQDGVVTVTVPGLQVWSVLTLTGE